MKPVIEQTRFGSITIDGETYGHDVIIRLDGTVKKRKKKLSKAVFGSSHTVSKDEAEYLYEKGAERIIIGSGQYGFLKLSEEAAAYFSKMNCRAALYPTPEAVQKWNAAGESAVGLFHTTC